MTRPTALRFLWPLAVYGATRLWVLAVVLWAAPRREVVMPAATGTAGLPPSYGEVMSSWDATYYADIASHGYPGTVYDAAGDPMQTALAFFPLYPALVRGVMAVTGLPFTVAGPTLSLVLGGVAVCVVAALVEQRLGRRAAVVAVVMLCCFVSAPILQAGYTESLALLLVATALLLLARRRYLWAVPVVLLLGLTRNVTLALVPVVALHWWARTSPLSSPPTRGDHLRLGVLVITCVAAGLQWPVAAGLVTGERDAYVDTVSAWDGYTGSVLDPPLVAAVLDEGVMGLALLAMLLLGLVWVLSRPSARRWGPELWGWAAAYPLYILLTAGATPSWMRYLLLAFPLGLVWAPVARRTPWWRRAPVACAAVLGLAAQAWWLHEYLVYAGPGGGRGYP